MKFHIDLNIVFLIIVAALQIRNSKACKGLWDNSCVRNEDCCSTFCEKEPHWAVGVCKQKSGSSGGNEVCKPLWDNTCSVNNDCCSEYCEKNPSWISGVCKPNKGSSGGSGNPQGTNPSLSEIEVFAKTVYAEARGEPEEGQIWVAWVIKNRARRNREHWGGSTIKGVCLKPGQFECWNGVSDIPIHEPELYRRVQELTNSVYAADHSKDPTGGSDHYNNPDKEGYPAWTNNCVRTRKIGNHQFYREL